MSPSERQIEEREARKQRILKGALEVFKSNGLEGATMDQIAQQSDFGRPGHPGMQEVARRPPGGHLGNHVG